VRADARRNHERIVAAARDAFAAHDIDIAMDEIAKRARIGAGTLYRHFPRREELVAAVYREEVSRLADRAHALRDELPAGEALFGWMREQVRWLRESSGLALTMKAVLEDSSVTYAQCREKLYTAASALLGPAQDAGVVRSDLKQRDLLWLGHGISLATARADEAGAERVLSVVLAGLHA
jgi:AcrR family transcriptional regulator